eukprot:TRINITY_DN2318_c0_g1_i2.p3 TRINITY_DN2318_c0_g1~~TRINITY_DN2318_c0_g1_i2.p3  ORF type:complete len:110 (+),score=28.68 TRINITY_DN2318_c0_g1_i2:123-452(+)
MLLMLVNVAMQMLFQLSLLLEDVVVLIEQWPDFGCEGIKVQRAHQPTSQCQGKKKIGRSADCCVPEITSIPPGTTCTAGLRDATYVGKCSNANAILVEPSVGSGCSCAY